MTATTQRPDPWNNRLDAVPPGGCEPFDPDRFGLVDPPPVFRSGGVQLGVGLTDELAAALRTEPGSVTVVSGLDTAGRLHLGHAVVLAQVRYYRRLGCQVRLPVVDLEAVAVRGTEPAQARRRFEESFRPLLAELGFAGEQVYLRSSVPSLLPLMAQLSGVLTDDLIVGVYGRPLLPAEQFAVLFMAADLVRPQLEGATHTLAVYGVDEAPHLLATNALARRVGLAPVAATFSVLVPALRTEGRKMSKSLERHGENVPLDADRAEIERLILSYRVRDPCLISVLRRELLTELQPIPEAEICTLHCAQCQPASARLVADYVAALRAAGTAGPSMPQRTAGGRPAAVAGPGRGARS